jgi:hypothetical protein
MSLARCYPACFFPPKTTHQRGHASIFTDYEHFLVTDSPEDAAHSLTEVAMRQFELTYGPRAKRRWFL